MDHNFDNHPCRSSIGIYLEKDLRFRAQLTGIRFGILLEELAVGGVILLLAM